MFCRAQDRPKLKVSFVAAFEPKLSDHRLDWAGMAAERAEEANTAAPRKPAARLIRTESTGGCPFFGGLKTAARLETNAKQRTMIHIKPNAPCFFKRPRPRAPTKHYFVAGGVSGGMQRPHAGNPWCRDACGVWCGVFCRAQGRPKLKVSFVFSGGPLLVSGQ